MSNKIDSATIFSRIKLLYNELTNKKDGWNNADVFAFLYGKSDDEQPYRKGAALHRWLLGYELPESLIFLRIKDSTFSLLVPTKIKKILEVLETTADDFPVKVKIIDFNSKDDADQKQKINQILSSLSDEEVLGLITKDKHEGDFANNWNILSKQYKSVDVTNGLSNVLSVKDAEQIKLVKKSGLITTSVLQKKFVPRMETIIDEEQKISHAQFSDEIEAIILDAKKNISDKLNSAMCDRCYSPIIQSGGTYDLRANAISNDENLHFGTIICSLGVRYRSYCSNVSRTFLIDPKKDQENNYLLLLDVQKACLKQMTVGNSISKIYKEAVQLITERNPSLLDKFVKSAGFGMGVEFREGSLIINAKNKKLIEEGMVFNLSIGFNDLLLQSEPKDKKKKNYALLISDTVVVNSNGPEIITKCKVNYSDIAYFLEEQEDEIKVTNTDSKVIEEIANSKVNTGRNDQIKNKLEEEENRKKHQKDLAEKQLKERMKAFSENNNNNSKGKESSSTQKDLISFTSFDEFSSEINDKNHQIIVDENHESVLLPIYGTLVPFHISTIKNVSKDNDTIRINFLFPGTAANMPLLNNQALKDSQKIFLREFLFRITNTQLLNNCIVSIKALQKTTKQQDQLSDTLRSIKKQEKLILNKAGKNPALHSVFIRPSISKRTTGSIEAHKNGVRFTPVRGATPIDILYKNVRHAFFQPADKDMIVAIHFHLYDAIMVGNKKTTDIQFCTEVTEASQTTQGKRRYHDEDELEDEQREREMKARLNAEYQRFAKNLEELTGGALEFDVPYKELGFYGVPFKSLVFIQPTVNCLVQLIEPPFFVLSLSDIEICNLERVQFNLQQFDAKFILKDFSKPVVNIDNIPVQYLETLKKWLDSCNINYYSMAGTLQWKRVMQTIRDDPENFFKMGGWRSVLESDSEDEQIEEVDDGDDDYGDAEDDDDDDQYDDDDDDHEDQPSLEMESGSDDGSDDGSEEDESDGEDWDAMEEKLRRDDMSSKEKRKRKGRDFSDDDSEDEPKRKKKAPSGPPPRQPPRKNAPPPTRRK